MGDVLMSKMMLRSSIVNSYKESKLSSIDSVPVGNVEAYNILKGDADVYEFINQVLLGEDHAAHPDSWTTVVLTPEWAQSYADAVKKTPKPLHIPGHAEEGLMSGKLRAIPDGYVTGGLVLGDTLYLRNTLIMKGSEEKQALIKQTVDEIKAGMLSTSTYDYMRYKLERDDETWDTIYYATESVKAQSNALVEADQTGADASIILTSFKDGGINHSEGEEQMGDKVVTNEERFTALKNQIDSGRLAISDVATSLGIDVMTQGDKLALKKLKDAEAIVGDISVFVQKVKEDAANTFVALKEAKLKEVFKDEKLVEVATGLFSLKEGNAEAVTAEVERIAGLQIFKSIAGAQASAINANFGGQTENNADDNGVMEG